MGEVRVPCDGKTSSRPKLLSFLYSRQVRFAIEQGRTSSIIPSNVAGLGPGV
jgi:hypothetical protein